MSFPNFIGIGAPRAGTTWLYSILKTHPDIWLPPLKELHYFDVIDPTVQRSSFKKKHIFSRLKHNIAFLTKPFWMKMFPDYVNKIKIDVIFDSKYIFGKFGDEWYKSLFNKKYQKNKLTGEITPSYCLLSEKYIKYITNQITYSTI